ncbi:MAG: hypothetical protein HFJ59_06175 [Clostridia bacterium]|nr:hypothetical protein [Clostridia bacterium]
MKISFIKYEKQENYQIPKMFGMHIEEIKEPEDIDQKIEELKSKDYTTIIITNELASFSSDIINKYQNDSINIIITPTKNNK